MQWSTIKVLKSATDSNIRKDAFLFGESQSRVIVSVSPENQSSFEQFMDTSDFNYTKLGEVFGDRINIDGEDYGEISEWKSNYDNTLGELISH